MSGARGVMKSRGNQRLPVCAAMLIFAITLAACGSAKSGSGTSTTQSSIGTTSDGPTSSTSDFYPPFHVVPKPDTPTTVPREGPGQKVTQVSGAGQQIIIMPNGFWPETLYANYEVPITWTNL